MGTHKKARSMQSLEERLWQNVDRREASECWPWTAPPDKDGYGRMSVNLGKRQNITRMAHRVAYELTYGALPDGLQVLHRCDNPPCCNPEHLFLGTNQDNMKDRDNKGRTATGNLKGKGNPKLTESQVSEIRRLIVEGVEGIALAHLYKVSVKTISRIKTGKTWPQLEKGAS